MKLAGDLNNERKMGPSGCARTWVLISVEILDLRVQRPGHRHKAEHELPAGTELELADPRARGAAELAISTVGCCPPEYRSRSRNACIRATPETMSVGRAGVALQEREQDFRVHVAEQPQRSRPEPLELCAELIDDPGARAHEILSRPGQRPDRLRLIRVGLKHTEAVMVGARQLAQHERVEPI